MPTKLKNLKGRVLEIKNMKNANLIIDTRNAINSPNKGKVINLDQKCKG